ncbi:MAG: FkbM family methyltransferase [Thermomicrobiales bacterium]
MIGRHGKDTILSALAVATSLPIIRAPLGGLARRGIIPSSIWSRLPVRGTFRLSLPDGSRLSYASMPGDFVGRSLYWRGLDGYEPETTRVFFALAQRSRVIVDVGANTGFFTLLACAANPHARVIAFEPVPRVFNRLNAQIALNGWAARCQTHRAAVSNRTGAITMHVPAGDLPHSASLDPHGFYGVAGDLIDVPVRTIDESCAGIDGIDLVKIDVEGFEDRVLAGMQGVLAAAAPAVIFEIIPHGPAAAVETALSRFGYRFYHLRQDGPLRVATIAPDPAGHERNYLAVARDDTDRLLGEAYAACAS